MKALGPLFLQATLTIASLSHSHRIVGSTLVPSAVRNLSSPLPPVKSPCGFLQHGQATVAGCALAATGVVTDMVAAISSGVAQLLVTAALCVESNPTASSGHYLSKRVKKASEMRSNSLVNELQCLTAFQPAQGKAMLSLGSSHTSQQKHADTRSKSCLSCSKKGTVGIRNAIFELY